MPLIIGSLSSRDRQPKNPKQIKFQLPLIIGSLSSKREFLKRRGSKVSVASYYRLSIISITGDEDNLIKVSVASYYRLSIIRRTENEDKNHREFQLPLIIGSLSSSDTDWLIADAGVSVASYYRLSIIFSGCS